MPDKEQIKFTDREKFVVSYYRSPELANSPAAWAHDLAFMLASITAAVLFVRDGEMAWAFASYFLLLGRHWYVVIEGLRWSNDFRSIIRKYDAMLAEIAASSFQSESESKMISR